LGLAAVPLEGRVGCGNCDVACELRVRMLVPVSSVSSPHPTEAIHVLPRLVYLAICRSVELLALLTRGDAAKDLEILVLRLSSSSSNGRPPSPSWNPPTALCSPPSAAFSHATVGPAFSSHLRRCSAGIAAWSQADGPIRVAAKGGRHLTMACSS
jgi:hypothetical protein